VYVNGLEATARDGLRRLGKAEDVSALALFLCSEKARRILGTAIAVDGGSTIGYYCTSGEIAYFGAENK
jgi:NAD(P)-dependent dehydrogenase (short-subunit alcohol dehydrogenase family)